MNDLVPSAAVEGRVRFYGESLYDPKVDLAQVCRRIGMVSQRPNPFPKSIYDNVGYGARFNGMRHNLDETVEPSEFVFDSSARDQPIAGVGRHMG